jgi:hypothetical protein
MELDMEAHMHRRIDLSLLLCSIGFIIGLTLLVGCPAKEDVKGVPSSQVSAPNSPSVSKFDTFGWKRVESSFGGFSIQITYGDKIIADSGEGMNFRPGIPVTVVNDMAPRGDGKETFSVFIGDSSYAPPDFAKSEKTDFGPVDGITGNRFRVDFVNVPDDWKMGYFEGERDYLYVFEKNGKFYYVIYVDSSRGNELLDLVEACVRTMKF